MAASIQTSAQLIVDAAPFCEQQPPLGMLLLAEAFRLSGDWAEAEVLLHVAYQRVPATPENALLRRDILSSLGDVSLQQNCPEEAELFLRQALKEAEVGHSKPFAVSAIFESLRAALVAQDRYEEAAEFGDCGAALFARWLETANDVNEHGIASDCFTELNDKSHRAPSAKDEYAGREVTAVVPVWKLWRDNTMIAMAALLLVSVSLHYLRYVQTDRDERDNAVSEEVVDQLNATISAKDVELAAQQLKWKDEHVARVKSEQICALLKTKTQDLQTKLTDAEQQVAEKSLLERKLQVESQEKERVVAALDNLLAADKFLREELPLVDDIETLQQDPTNRKANLNVGKYLCFVMNQWVSGTQHLAKAGLKDFDEIARREREAESSTEARRILGDLWWHRAEVVDGEDKYYFQARAKYCYQLAFPDCRDLTKEGVEAYVSGGSVDLQIAQVPSTVSIANWTLSSQKELSPEQCANIASGIVDLDADILALPNCKSDIAEQLIAKLKGQGVSYKQAVPEGELKPSVAVLYRRGVEVKSVTAHGLGGKSNALTAEVKNGKFESFLVVVNLTAGVDAASFAQRKEELREVSYLFMNSRERDLLVIGNFNIDTEHRVEEMQILNEFEQLRILSNELVDSDDRGITFSRILDSGEAGGLADGFAISRSDSGSYIEGSLRVEPLHLAFPEAERLKKFRDAMSDHLPLVARFRVTEKVQRTQE